MSQTIKLNIVFFKNQKKTNTGNSGLYLIRISLISALIILLSPTITFAQYIPVHISNSDIYEYLDELAANKIIELNSSIKPYSRSFISEKLNEAENRKNTLSRTQIERLEYYKKDFSKHSEDTLIDLSSKNTAWLWINKEKNQRLDFFDYHDSDFQITVNPILGSDIWANENGSFYNWWNGVETYASKGNFSLWASLRDNHESMELTNRDFQNQRIGGANIKPLSSGNRDFEEMRGGMAWSWDWGHIGLMMDQFSWGDASNGTNIFSGRTPAFTRIDFQLNPVKWLQFNYVHGWLNSEVIDSSKSFWVVNSYGSEYREVYHTKFLAANMFTLKPFKNFSFGVGNSVIHDHSTAHAAFFIPVMFWKAVDHSLNARIDNMNSQMFFTLSSRNIKGLHIYGSAFIDEIQVGRIFRDGEYNFSSFKAGVTSFHLPLTSIHFEYTWSNALIFRHYVTTTTFESNSYNLGHFLEDNARDIYAALEFRPWKTIKLKAYYNNSIKGLDHTYLGTESRTTLTPLDPVVWESSKTGILGSIQITHGMNLRLGYEWRNIEGVEEWIEMWTPDVYHGKTGTFCFGLNYGF